MRTRHRSRLKWVIGGYVTHISSGTKYPQWYKPYEETFDDVVGKVKRKKPRLLPPSDMDHDLTERYPCWLSGETNTYRGNYLPAGASYVPNTYSYPTRGSAARNTENSYYANILVANTHPFRNLYSVPVSIVEMLDLGSLFKIAAKGFLDLVGGGYLNYKFGWVQFVNDIKTLQSITKGIASRVREFDSLNKSGGLRREHVFLASSSPYTSSGKGDWTLWSTYGLYVNSSWKVDTHYKIWGSIRWQWKDGVTVSLSKLEAFNLAVEKVFDLGQLDASTIWNAIPWTWLVDYFVDINSFLSANENNDLLQPYDICIMREWKTKETWYPLVEPGKSNLNGGVGHYYRTIKSRDWIPTLPVLPAIRYSFLNKNQVLTLAALYGKFSGSSY